MSTQRITDWLRERRIKRLSSEVLRLAQTGQGADARALQVVWIAEINARSPAQIERMERRMRSNA
jgi:hypothetical protein